MRREGEGGREGAGRERTKRGEGGRERDGECEKRDEEGDGRGWGGGDGEREEKAERMSAIQSSHFPTLFPKKREWKDWQERGQTTGLNRRSSLYLHSSLLHNTTLHSIYTRSNLRDGGRWPHPVRVGPSPVGNHGTDSVLSLRVDGCFLLAPIGIHAQPIWSTLGTRSRSCPALRSGSWDPSASSACPRRPLSSRRT